MKNITLVVLLIIIIGAVGMFVLKNSGTLGDSGTARSQDIVLSFKNYNYYPNTITVEAGRPVKISLDSSVSGCYRAFTIRELGISKYLQTPQDFIEFTSVQKGTYRFSCAMGMGTGTLVVE